ncbi:MAG: HD family phosphohydrolase [Saccharofermentanales bacterium]
MNSKLKIRIYFQYLVMLIVAAGIVFSMYYVSIPEKYNLKTGEASPYDINASRSVVDAKATLQRAAQASAAVPDVMLVNAGISRKSLNNLEGLFEQAKLVRDQYYVSLTTEEPMDIDAAALLLQSNVNAAVSKELASSDCKILVEMDNAAYESYSRNIMNIAEVVMSYSVSAETLPSRIAVNVNSIAKGIEEYGVGTEIITSLLTAFLEPNLEFNKAATDEARALAAKTVTDNPVMIEKGARIISFGETITTDKYALLREMGLINTGEFDFVYLGGVILMILLLISVGILYIQKNEKENIHTIKDKISIGISMLIPFALSIFLVKISIFAPPVYIAAVLITAYFGFRAGMLMSVLITFAIYPLTSFDPKFLVVAVIGSTVAALFTMGIAKRNNYALIIITTTMSCFLATVAMNILTKSSVRDTLIDASYAVTSSSISVMLAIGIMPLFEMIFNSVSPMRLIELSQPGSPLLSRLFTEAPGTSQHCVMVANLAEAGAEAIGANPLVARVGAYYHDIGKLENPEMFTENQSGYNPHDELEPKVSAGIILAHPESGLRLARKYRLPTVICKMIYEHHGTSRQMYFLRKAQEQSEKNDLATPDPNQYKYRTARPTFKESAILMLADTVEAAMKSTGITNLDKAEDLIRRLVRNKIEEDQLVDSDLSFRDVENLIQAFLHVYSGHFRIRVRYPDDIADKE